MPFTPFHLGIALLLYSLIPFLDPLALFVGSVAPDIEGLSVIFIFRDPSLPLHGPFHSFLGALTLALVIAPISYIINYYVLTVLIRKGTINQSKKYSLVSSILGTFSHIFLDAPLYPEMDLFYPLKGNILYQVVPFYFPYLICTLGFIFGLVIILRRYYERKQIS